MCMGGKSKSAPVTPAPAPVQTKFEYVNADNSNAQQRQAAVMSSTAGTQPQSFGSELGSSGGVGSPAAVVGGAV